MSTFILPFDHRSGFARDIMHTTYPFSKTDRERAQDLKILIYEAFLNVIAQSAKDDTYAILADEETCSGVLHNAHERGIMTIMTLEVSGEPILRLQYGEQSAHRLRIMGASVGKTLLRFTSFPQENDRQLQTLAQLARSLQESHHPLLVELLFSGEETVREDFLAHTIPLAESMGIIPEYWKVESLPNASAWKHIRTLTNPSSQLVLLGRGEARTRVDTALCIASQASINNMYAVDGFAIGRTLFAEPLRAFLKKTSSRAQTVHAIADAFSSAIELWKSSRT